MTATGDVEPRHRLHPLSPLLRGARSFAVVVGAISLQGFAQLGLVRGGIVVLLAVLGALALSWVSWWYTGYQVVHRELRVYEGLLWRRSRAIALERLQSVEVVRPLLARLAGLAELRLEVIGAAKTEAPLAFLTVAEAEALRDHLLSVSAGSTAPATAAAHPAAPPGPGGAVPAASGEAVPPAPGGTVTPGPAEPPEHVLHRVAPRDLLLGQLLTPQALTAPFAVTASLLSFTVNPNLSLIGIVTAITAALGIALRPIRRVIAEYGFTVSTTTAGLRLRHGLTETRSQTVPPGRVQALAQTWPLLWRPLGWVRCRIDVAGYTGGDGQQATGGTLLPVAEPAVAYGVVSRVLPGAETRVPLLPPPPKARYRVPLRYRVLAAGLGEHVFAVRDGLLTRELLLVPYVRIQSVRIVRGPWQRRLGLATVHIDTAGLTIAVAAEHRDLAEARWLAAELIARAHRAGRAGERAAPPAPAAGDQPPESDGDRLPEAESDQPAEAESDQPAEAESDQPAEAEGDQPAEPGGSRPPTDLS